MILGFYRASLTRYADPPFEIGSMPATMLYFVGCLLLLWPDIACSRLPVLACCLKPLIKLEDRKFLDFQFASFCCLIGFEALLWIKMSWMFSIRKTLLTLISLTS